MAVRPCETRLSGSLCRSSSVGRDMSRREITRIIVLSLVSSISLTVGTAGVLVAGRSWLLP